MSGGHLRMRAQASQRRAPAVRRLDRRSKGWCLAIRFIRRIGRMAGGERFAGAVPPRSASIPAVYFVTFFASQIVVYFHLSFEVSHANIQSVEVSICDLCT